MDEAMKLEEGARVLSAHLYARTAQSKVTGKKNLLLHPPEGLDNETAAALLASLNTPERPDVLEKVATVQGKKDSYYYDSGIMTKHYAELDALLEDKDILATIATVTRSDSKLYPRPTQFSKLTRRPFGFTMDEILGAVARMKNEEAYQDIGMVTASNGNSGLYSEKHMSKRYAQSLIQQIEVDELENP